MWGLALATEFMRVLLSVGVHLVAPSAQRLCNGPSAWACRVLVTLAQCLVDAWQLGPEEKRDPSDGEVNRLICQHVHGTLQPTMLDVPVGSGKVGEDADLRSAPLLALQLVRRPVGSLALARAVNNCLADATLLHGPLRAFAADHASLLRQHGPRGLPLVPARLEDLLQLLLTGLVALCLDLGHQWLHLIRQFRRVNGAAVSFSTPSHLCTGSLRGRQLCLALLLLLRRLL
mmetsp:Transcript_331/g.796  ORF Transcript_331/g.796 Transcript_331/m.796 type:complete len:231 (-) Transcript_331:86-778(-)